MNDFRIDFKTLIIKAQEGILTDEERVILNDLMKDPENQTVYFEMVKVNCALIQLESSERQPNTVVSANFDPCLWKALANEEKTAQPVDIPQKVTPREPIRKLDRHTVRFRINRNAVFTLLTSAAAVVTIVLSLHFAPKTGVEVATLSDSIHAKWADAEKIEIGQRFVTGSANLLLREGCAELLFDNQARITVEAPAEFQILTGDQIGLNYGRVYATVPEQAYGFTVSTSNGKIIDLGTEFGIQRDLYGNTELHVVKGRTTLIANTQGNRINISVAEGDARKLSALTGEVETIALQKDLFVREIDSKSNLIWKGQTFIDLADVVGGGNGLLQGQIAGSIDPATGDIHSKAVQQNGRTGVHSYKAVPESQFVDGVFVPNGVYGASVVSSAGHKCEFPKTSGIYFSDITTTPYAAKAKGMDGGYEVHPAYLNGNEKESSAFPLILIHANAGITFDLNSMRRSLPNVEIDQFTSKCGVSKSLEATGRSEFWVLLDGVCVFHYLFDGDNSRVTEIDVPIRPEQKFLTLATTDGGDEYGLDWCIFEQPKLHLATSE